MEKISSPHANKPAPSAKGSEETVYSAIANDLLAIGLKPGVVADTMQVFEAICPEAKDVLGEHANKLGETHKAMIDQVRRAALFCLSRLPPLDEQRALGGRLARGLPDYQPILVKSIARGVVCKSGTSPT